MNEQGMTTQEDSRASSSFGTVTFHSPIDVGMIETERQLHEFKKKEA